MTKLVPQLQIFMVAMPGQTLGGLALLALLSHLLLDFTNNYGIRPFFPFDPHWYAASIVFIFDPLIFLLLLAAVVIPSIFRLVSSEVGSRRQPFAARGWAIAALVCIVCIWSFRAVQHQHALQIAMAQSAEAPVMASPTPPSDDSTLTQPQTVLPDAPPPVYLQAQRALASPDPINPFRWFTVTDFGPLYQLGEVNTRQGSSVPGQRTQPKLNPTPALLAAEASPLGRVYLDWSPMPFLTVLPPTAGSSITAVILADPRFMGDSLLLHSSNHAPLTGEVDLDPRNRVLSQSLDGRQQ